MRSQESRMRTGDHREVIDVAAQKKPVLKKTRVPMLEVFANPHPKRRYTIEIIQPEFTSVCPKTGQPDFGTLIFTYVPDQVCVELKSLKIYLQQFRNEGIFYEAVTNRIMDDFLAVVKPRSAKIESRWTPRGGLNSNIIIHFPDPSSH